MVCFSLFFNYGSNILAFLFILINRKNFKYYYNKYNSYSFLPVIKKNSSNILAVHETHKTGYI